MSKKPKPPLPKEPFTLQEVLDAARTLMGFEVLPPAVDVELREMVDGYQKRLKHLHNAHCNQNRYRQSDALKRVCGCAGQPGYATQQSEFLEQHFLLNFGCI